MTRIYLFCLFYVFALCETYWSNELLAQEIPAHHGDVGFKNLYIEDPDKNIFDYLRLRYFGNHEWSNHRIRADEVPIQLLDLNEISNESGRLKISWLGHSTFLIQYGGINILTDPIFSNRASPFRFVGPKRYIPHVIDYTLLPEIDFVVISHNHYDHLDKKAVKLLGENPFYLVPLGLSEWFEENGVSNNRVKEFDWWQHQRFDQLSITAMPSQHWSSRSLSDRLQTLWASWSIDFTDIKLWFAGDTGYNPVQFKEIGRHSDGFDVSLIPIGGYLPRGFMSAYHVNPSEAIQIHKDVKSTFSIGMHWGTFPLTAEGPIDPKLELEKQISAHGISDKDFATMSVGETLSISP